MKSIVSWLVLVVMSTGCRSAHDAFTLKGKLDGLQKGDTLLLSSILLPRWKPVAVDTFYAEKGGKFSYCKKLPHTTLLLLDYLPVNSVKKESCFLGAPVLGRPGDVVRLEGHVDRIGALRKRGGFYSDSLVARYDSLSNDFSRMRNDIYDRIVQAREAHQPDSVAKYGQMYNRLQRPESLKLTGRYLENEVHDNEFAACLYLQKLHEVSAAELENRLTKFTPEVRRSFMGQALDSLLSVLRNIEPGVKSAGFTVTDSKGNRVSLSDYAGKYVLIYHWGICPGTLWVHPKLLRLYERFHDKGFEVLGFTESDLANNESLKRDKELRSVAEPLLNQPWTTVFTGMKGNEFICNDYSFSGVPILMLVSPDGTTLVRGYNDVYAEVEKILEDNLDVKPE